MMPFHFRQLLKRLLIVFHALLMLLAGYFISDYLRLRMAVEDRERWKTTLVKLQEELPNTKWTLSIESPVKK